MYSPRSVSTGRIPAASSASLSRISSAAIDFDFATSFASRRRQTSTTYAHASSAVAQTRDVAAAGLERPPKLVQVAVDVTDRLHADVVRALAQLLDVREARPTRRAGARAAVRSSARSAPWTSASASFVRATSRKCSFGCASSRHRAAIGHAERPWRGRSARCRPGGRPQLSDRGHARRCIRQPGSAVTSASAPTAPAREQLVVGHRDRHLGLTHRERAAETAAEIRPRQHHHVRARALEQPARGRRISSSRSMWQESW